MSFTNQEGPAMTRPIVKRFVQILVYLFLMACALFISAGRLDWVMAWVVLGIYLAGVVINGAIMMRRCPDLIGERAEFRQDAKRWDKPLAFIMGLFGPLSTYIVAGLDTRWGWTRQVAAPLVIAGIVVTVLGFALVSWAMVSNKFFSSLVRIQQERGHTVMTGGPYRFVRHPGYVGMVAYQLAMPLMLQTFWAFVPAAVTTGFAILRTALEDRTLQEELTGYKEYVGRVRYRLIPGIW
jgi:protein-S-isoprenylcysteine O-methyltransferase Ste14